MKQYPEPTVGALIFDKDKRLFLMTSPKWNGKYIVPGGHIEIGETIEQALKREIKEETNLKIEDIRFLCMSEQINNKEFHNPKHFIFIDYVCRAASSDVRLNSEGGEFVWVSVSEALELPLVGPTRETILKFKKSF